MFKVDGDVYKRQGTRCSELICQMFEVMDKRQTGYEFFTVGLMWQLFGQILHDHSYTVTDMAERRNAKSTEQIKTVLNYIRKNYASRLTLACLLYTSVSTSGSVAAPRRYSAGA